MADAGAEGEEEETSEDPLSPKDYEELGSLLESITNQPYQYSAHLRLIELLRRAYHGVPPGRGGDMLIELRKAREEMVEKFPLKENGWLEWIEDETARMKGYEGRQFVMELCGRAVVDQVASTKLWKAYAEFVEAQQRDASAEGTDLDMNEEEAATFRELFQQEVVVDTYRQGASATNLDIANSHELWDRYRDLLMMDLQANPSASKIEKIYSIYKERLQTPHATISDTFSAFSSFVTQFDNENYEEVLVHYNKLYSAAAGKYSDREIYETNLLREIQSVSAPDENEWHTWSRYLKYETTKPNKRIDVSMASFLYERCLLRFGEQARVWEDYVFFVLEKANETPRVISLLQRATRHCPWSGTLWAQYIVALERGFKPFEEVSEVKHRATKTALLDLGGMEEVLKVNIAWCGFLKRRAFEHDSTEEDSDMAEMGIVEAVSEISNKDCKTKDPHYRIQRIQINFYTHAKKLPKARQIWQELAKEFAFSYEFWLRYYEWELAHGSSDAAGKVIHSAVYGKKLDWPEKILETWKYHVEDFGNVDEVENMMVKYRKISGEILERRLEEAAAQQAVAAEVAEQQQEYQPAEPQPEPESEPGSKGKKRKVEDEVEEDSHSAKKAKGENEEPAAPVVSIPDLPPTAMQVLKRDRENATIIVKNLPPGYPEVKVRQFFRDCGTINSLKVVEENNGKSSTATVEFDSKDDTLAAQTKDGKIVEDHTISIQVGTGSTLYVANFPPIADESYIRDLFKDCGEIVDIRFPSLKFNSHRRFCYVQFTSSEQAKKATQLNGKQLGEKETLVALISAPNQKKDRSGATQEGREVYVRNIDFHAREKDVREIFEKFGTIEKIRLPPGPKKGLHKGFGFVVFSTKDEADASLSTHGTTLMSRNLDVSIAIVNPGKLKPGNAVDVARSMSPAAAADQANGSSPRDPDAQKPSFDEITKKTLGVMNLPDTVNDLRIHALFSPFGPLRKVTLRPDHQGAVVEYESVADAGKASLKLDGHEVDGHKIEIGSYKDLMKRAPLKKITKGFAPAPRKPLGPPLVPASVRNAPSAAGRGGKRRGLGFSGAIHKKDKEADVDMKDTPANADGEKKGGRSNDDFKKMFLKGS
ncbi:hypothetical protein EDC01DRAFT_715678 [Geopyxis carbonaria]|nr:hypothetical protein EDC01DRAFT_715678 [Geopyxis carbonaria]